MMREGVSLANQKSSSHLLASSAPHDNMHDRSNVLFTQEFPFTV